MVALWELILTGCFSPSFLHQLADLPQVHVGHGHQDQWGSVCATLYLQASLDHYDPSYNISH